MSAPLLVLIVDDSQKNSLPLVDELRKHGYDPEYLNVETPESTIAALLKREMELEAHKREFYTRTIVAATDGKLVICEPEDIRRMAGQAVHSWTIANLSDINDAREEIDRIAVEHGMDAWRVMDFLGCAVEAMANIHKHAGGGLVTLHAIEDGLMLVASDTGPGIEALALPDVALTKGYSTAISLGMGYKLMIEFADKVYLATSAEGTMVAIEMRFHPASPPGEAPVSRPARPKWFGYAATVLMEVVMTVGLAFLAMVFPLPKYPIPYVLLTMLVAYVFGTGPAVVAVLLGWFGFTYFATPPRGIAWPPASSLDDWAGQVALLLGLTVVAIAMTQARKSNRRIAERTRQLEAEMRERQRAEEAVKMLNTHLERRIAERTSELRRTVEKLDAANKELKMRTGAGSA